MRANADKMADAARFAVLAVAAVVPLANAVPQAWGSTEAVVTSYFDTPKLLAFSLSLAVAAGLWAVALVVGSLRLRQVKTSGWALGVVLGVGLVSAVAGVHPPTAFFGDSYQHQGLLAWLGYGLFWFLVVQTISTKKHATLAAWVLTLTGMMVAFYDLVQILWIDTTAWGVDKWMANRGISTLGNPNHLGGYLVVPLVLAVSLSFAAEGRLRKTVAGVTAVSCAAAIALTLTRGSWVAALVGLGVLSVAIVRSRDGRAKWSAAVTAAVLVGGAGLAWLVRPELMAGVLRRLQASATGGSGRSTIWGEAVRVIADRPLLGAGPDSYRLAWYGERSPELMRDAGMGIVVTEPHNVLLAVAATFGLVAMLAFVAFVGVTVWRARSAVWNDARNPRTLALSGWWSACVALLVYLMMGASPIPLTLTLFMCLGVLAAAAGRTVTDGVAALLVGPVGVALLVAAGVLWAGVGTFAADVEMTAALAGDAESIAHAESATRRAPWSTEARLRLADVYAHQVPLAQSAAALDAVQRASAEYERAVSFSPKDVDAYWEYAYFLSNSTSQGLASPEQVVEVAEKGLAVDRHSLGLAMIGASALRSLGRHDEVVALLDDLWNLDPQRHEPGVAYARALVETGDIAGAQRVARELTSGFPDESSVSDLASSIASVTAGSR